MPELIFNQYQPVFDVAYSIAREIVYSKNRSVVARFPAKPEARDMTGLALDTRAFMLKLNRFISHEVFLDNQCIYQKDKHQSNSCYRLRLILDSLLEYNGRKKTEFHDTSKIEFSNMRKIEYLSIASKENKRTMRDERSELELFLDRKGLLPSVQNKIAIEMVYGGPFSYAFTFRYHDYHPLSLFSFERHSYPVSDKLVHSLQFPQWHLWRFFTSPVYWFQKSCLFALALDHIARKVPLDEIVEQTYPNPLKRGKHGEIFKQQLQDIVPLVYVFIEAYVNQEELTAGIEHLPTKYQPFALYKKEFLSQIRKSILHFAFHVTDSEVDNIVYGYNRDYLPTNLSYRKREISFGDFLKGNANQDYRKRIFLEQKEFKRKMSKPIEKERMEKTTAIVHVPNPKS